MYVLDANVLIDYRDSDLKILSLFSQAIGQIIVPSLIANEVKNISNEELQALSLQIYEPNASELVQAFGYSGGGLSHQDCLCFILAHKYQWWCITNEKLLRNECERKNIKTIRGLRLLIELCKGTDITPMRAEEVALQIQKANPFHISETIIETFRAEIYL